MIELEQWKRRKDVLEQRAGQKLKHEERRGVRRGCKGMKNRGFGEGMVAGKREIKRERAKERVREQ